MNKSDKLIVFILVALLGAWLYYSNRQQVEYQKAKAAWLKAHPEYTNAVPDQATAPAADPVPAAPAEIAAAPAPAEEPAEAAPAEPERTLAVSNAVMDLVFTSKGGALASATLRDYRRALDPGSGPVVLDFAGAPALALEGFAGLGAKADFSLEEKNGVVRMSARSADGWVLERTVACTNGYHLAVTDSFRREGGAAPLPAMRVALGPIAPEPAPSRGFGSIGPTEGLDVRVRDARGRAQTLEQNAMRPLVKKLSPSFSQMFGAAGGGGCSCSSAPLPPTAPLSAAADFGVAAGEAIDWIAVRDRFFVEVLTPGEPAASVRTSLRRRATPSGAPLAVEAVAASLGWSEAPAAEGPVVRTYSLYVGPRKMDELRRIGPAYLDVMRFGTWSWFCRWLLDLLNFIHRFVPNYGWAIVVLTLLVRVVLLPLSRKSQQSMRKMSELQPKMKEINEKYKDEPQKRQAETMRLYAENHVNPLSSCLPMLIQLPVFIALFTVLRSSVELRFAPWLWVADLSAPEGLFKEWFPFGGLNILPVAMAATMTLQSLLTPSAGDPKQQRMMAVMMPVMMLVMFYSMPAALCLYWSVSQALAILGLWWARRSGAKPAGGSFVQKDGTEVIPPKRR
jgi:YidC/Oxa1 family membrane protein insertase